MMTKSANRADLFNVISLELTEIRHRKKKEVGCIKKSLLTLN